MILLAFSIVFALILTQGAGNTLFWLQECYDFACIFKGFAVI